VRRPSGRVVRLALLICSLAIFAGVVAAAALAATETYCNVCNLPSNGTPSVSSVRSTYTANQMSTVSAEDLQIFNYQAASGIQSCPMSMNSSTFLSISCNPSTLTADARCHLLHGTGPTLGTCKATYS